MHKVCQIPHLHRRLRPLSPLLDLATLTTVRRVPSLLIREVNGRLPDNLTRVLEVECRREDEVCIVGGRSSEIKFIAKRASSEDRSETE